MEGKHVSKKPVQVLSAQEVHEALSVSAGISLGEYVSQTCTYS